MNKKLFLKSKGAAPGTIIYEGDTAPVQTNITYCRIMNDKVIESSVIDSNTKNKAITWVRITGLADSSRIVEALKPFNISNLTLEDVFETYHNPKFDDTFDYNFIIMRSLSINTAMQDNQIAFIQKDNFLITFEEYHCDEFNIVLQRIYKHFNNFYTRGSNYLLYALIDAVIDNYIMILNSINLSVDSIEDTMIQDVTCPCDTSELFTLKRHINFLSRHTRASYDVINQLLKLSIENNSEDTLSIVPYYEDLWEHAVYLNEAILYCKDSIRSVYDENMSRMQLKSNKFINILTLLSTLMLPPVVIAGIFGMNFEEIPFSSYTYGFTVSVFIMFAVSFMLAWFFKKKKYF
ncbi:MAG: hypothetical protein K2N11_07775 [Mucispirillum sp.]|nr:hypothetical protein [Mucispirillum sp.]